MYNIFLIKYLLLTKYELVQNSPLNSLYNLSISHDGYLFKII